MHKQKSLAITQGALMQSTWALWENYAKCKVDKRMVFTLRLRKGRFLKKAYMLWKWKSCWIQDSIFHIKDHVVGQCTIKFSHFINRLNVLINVKKSTDIISIAFAFRKCIAFIHVPMWHMFCLKVVWEISQDWCLRERCSF